MSSVVTYEPSTPLLAQLDVLADVQVLSSICVCSYIVVSMEELA